jgi:hypothetical protein
MPKWIENLLKTLVTEIVQSELEKHGVIRPGRRDGPVQR